MTFVDSNVPMYLIGAAHPLKTEAQLILERLIAAGERLVSDAEVLQEVIHRYTALSRREAIRPAFDVILQTVDEIYAIEKRDALRAGEIVEHRDPLSARNAIHIAIMERHDIRSIFSFDADFDRWPGLHRIYRL